MALAWAWAHETLRCTSQTSISHQLLHFPVSPSTKTAGVSDMLPTSCRQPLASSPASTCLFCHLLLSDRKLSKHNLETSLPARAWAKQQSGSQANVKLRQSSYTALCHATLALQLVARGTHIYITYWLLACYKTILKMIKLCFCNAEPLAYFGVLATTSGQTKNHYCRHAQDVAQALHQEQLDASPSFPSFLKQYKDVAPTKTETYQTHTVTQ